MDGTRKDDIPMLSGRNRQSDRNDQKVSHMSSSVTISVPMTSLESISDKKAQQEQAEQEQTKPLDYQWGVNDKVAKNAHLYKAGKLGMCDDPYCTTCPTSYTYKGQLITRRSRGFDHRQFAYGGAKGWGRRAQEKLSLMKQSIRGIINPHNKAVQHWIQFIAISCLFAIFIDPLFVYLLSTDKVQKCIKLDWPMTKAIVVFRSVTDFIYFMHMLVQFRLAFVSPESKVVGAGDLVDDPRKIALHYLSRSFPLDLFIVLPLPQIIVLLFLRHSIGSSGANYAKNLLRTAILVQYLPRLYRFLPLLAGQSPTNFIFETAWANFVINLLTFVLAGHVVGSCWYLFGLQRVNQCLRDACHNSGFNETCKELIDCGHGRFEKDEPDRTPWKQHINSIACFDEDGFSYGIYVKAVNLTAESIITRRYIYSFFWGFQQISTLAGNLVPSYFEWEVLFTMGIIGLGLLLFALLIGNMQRFLEGLGKRRLDMSLRQSDFEKWMRHRHLPDDLRKKVKDSERYNWAATQGVNEENLMEHLPEDLQRDIRRHLFEFVKKVHIFAAMDEPILDAICEKLRQKTYIKDGTPIYKGGVITKMVFIVRGQMVSEGEDGIVPLLEGGWCGEELLLRCLKQSSDNGDTGNQIKLGDKLLSKRTVKCLTNVEAFVLRAVDLEEVATLFAGSLSTHRVQRAIRNESPSERGKAATTIQVKWRYMKQLRHANTSNRGATLPSKFK